MRNPLLSTKLKRTETRLLIIDDNQIGYNRICELLQTHDHKVNALLLDDLHAFEKQLQQNWDLVIFGRAYDLKFEQALTLIRASKQSHLPFLLLKPDDYQAEQYASYIRKGVYDLVNLDFPERFYFGCIRALSFSRSLQAQNQLVAELDVLQSHAQALVKHSHKAVAKIQEGIHIQANAEYLQLFSLKDESELIGVPLLDLLQPEDLNNFKFRFKKISQGNFDFARFDLHSLNPTMTAPNPLKIEFMQGTEEDELQLSIDIANASLSEESTTLNASTPIDEPVPAVVQTSKSIPYQQINRTLTQQPANMNALVLFSLASCPEAVFQSDWLTAKAYFLQIKAFLKEQTNAPLFKIDTGLVVGLFQAESEDKLKSKLIGLNALAKPQLLAVAQGSYPLHLRMGYRLIEQEISDAEQLEQLVAQAFKNPLPNSQQDDALGLTIALDGQEELNPSEEISLLQQLKTSLDNAEIHLKYQQLYDKEDQNIYTYEVTSGFIYHNGWQGLQDLYDLSEDQELSIKLDRWILVESCKQLHNFITQYPQAKLIVNLNKHALLFDETFPDLIGKLISIIGSRVEYPLILQFSEADLSQHLAEALKKINILREYGAQISIRDFGTSLYSESLLKQVDVQYLTLDAELTQALLDEEATAALQEKLVLWNEIRPLQTMLRDLNDMTLFANAWNVDVRFMQGDYFQKKLDNLIDTQDQ